MYCKFWTSNVYNNQPILLFNFYIYWVFHSACSVNNLLNISWKMCTYQLQKKYPENICQKIIIAYKRLIHLSVRSKFYEEVNNIHPIPKRYFLTLMKFFRRTITFIIKMKRHVPTWVYSLCSLCKGHRSKHNVKFIFHPFFAFIMFKEKISFSSHTTK